MPHVPAANTTCPAVKVRAVRLARHAPVRTVSTAYPAAPRRPHRDRHGFRMHRRAGPFGQIQIVLDERVLRVVPAAGHALPGLQAAAAARAGAAEERIVDLHAGFLAAVPAEEHPDRGHAERVPDPHLLGNLLHDLIRRCHRRVAHHAQHPFRLVVIGRELGAPVGDVRPLAVAVKGVLRLVERVGVHERASADPRAGQDDHVPQQVDPLDAQAAELRRPEEPAGVPGSPGIAGVLEPASRLEHTHPVALLGEPQRGDRAAETRADHEHVIVILTRHSPMVRVTAPGRQGRRSPKAPAGPMSLPSLAEGGGGDVDGDRDPVRTGEPSTSPGRAR